MKKLEVPGIVTVLEDQVLVLAHQMGEDVTQGKMLDAAARLSLAELSGDPTTADLARLIVGEFVKWAKAGGASPYVGWSPRIPKEPRISLSKNLVNAAKLLADFAAEVIWLHLTVAVAEKVGTPWDGACLMAANAADAVAVSCLGNGVPSALRPLVAQSLSGLKSIKSTDRTLITGHQTRAVEWVEFLTQ